MTSQPFNEEWEKFLHEYYEYTEEAEVSRYLTRAREHIDSVLHNPRLNVADCDVYEEIARAQVFIENALQIVKEANDCGA